MTEIQGTALDAAGQGVEFADVKIALVTSSSSTPGYTGSGEILQALQVSANQAGAWTANLIPNTAITPANTYYIVTEGRGAVSDIVVPATGGPYQLTEVLVTPPPTPEAPGITGIQVAADGTVEGVRPEINLIAGTNVTVTAADNPSANRVDVTLTATGGGGGGAVDSVNGQTGVVILTAADVSAIPTSAEGAASGVATLDVSGHLTALQAANLLVAANNLSDLPNAATARGNLGLGTAATQASSAFDAAGSAATAQTNAISTAEANAAATYVPLAGGTMSGPLAMGASKITGVANGTLATDAAAFGQIPAALPPNGSAGGDLTGTYPNPTVTATANFKAQVETVRLDQMATPTASVGLGSQKITALANGTLPTDAAAFGQIPTSAASIGGLLAASNLSDVANATTARSNLGLGGAATLNVGTTAGTVAAGDDSRITGAAQKAANLSDLANTGTARTNLGLGGAAVLNVGTATGTVAAGDDSRITGALQRTGGTMSGAIAMGTNKVTGLANGTVSSDAAAFGQIPTSAATIGGLLAASNLSDLANAGTARTNLGLGGAATLNVGTGASTVAAGNDTRITGALQAANNLSDLGSAATARANLGLTGSLPYSADTPAQRGWSEWNFAPSQGSVAVSQNFTSGTIYGVSLIAQTNNTISKVGVQVVSSAGTPTAGQNLIGLYTISGTTATQLTATGDIGTWSSAGFQSYALGASQTLVAGSTYLILFMSNASSAVHLQGITSDTAAQVGFLNLGLSSTAAPWLKFFVNGTTQTALPASFTISGTTMSPTNALAPWACLL